MQNGETREYLLNLIAAKPGLYKTEICSETGLCWGTITYHLDILLREGRILAHEDSGRVHFFIQDTTLDEVRWLMVLRRELSTKIIKSLENNGPSQMYELANDLGVSRKVIRKHLTLLENQGAVSKEGYTRPRYSLLKGMYRRLFRR